MPESWTNWVVQGDLTNPEFIALPEKALLPEFPLSVWQCDPLVDNGNASIPLFPDWVRIEIKQVAQLPYIQVFPINTPQSTLETSRKNGTAILIPTECIMQEELCGMWAVNLTHPLDPEERYKLLLVGNILKVNGQYFTIKSTEEHYENGTGYVTVYAECLWYQWGDGWIYGFPFNPTHIEAKNGQEALDNIKLLTVQDAPVGGTIYSFRAYSPMVYDNVYTVDLESGCTPIELVLGERGLIACKGGELYRNNFEFSVCPRKEDARDNAFDIRLGKNLKGVKRTIDTSTMATYFTLTNGQTGDGVSWAWDGASTHLRNLIPHHTIRSEIITYPEGAIQGIERLTEDAYRIFNQNCRPIISYEIDLEDVRNNPDFSITSDESLRCGDTGTVYDERLGGTVNVEITQTTYDCITGKCLSITIGNTQSFVYHATDPIIYDLQPEFVGGEVWVRDSTGRYLYDADGVKIIMEVSGNGT